MSFQILECHSIQKCGENQLSSISNENIMDDNLKPQIKNLNQHKYTKMMKNILLIKERCSNLCNDNGMHQNFSVNVLKRRLAMELKPYYVASFFCKNKFCKVGR